MQEKRIHEAVDVMIHTERMHKLAIDSKAQEIGIHRTQHRILMHLARRGSLPSQKELAEHLGVSAAAVTGALKRIERDGYIKRSLGQDNRYNELTITEKGREIVEKTKKLFSETDISLFDGFTDEEIEAYISCLKKIQQNIKSHTDITKRENT